MKNKLRTKSLNAASYISEHTGKIANIVSEETGLNHFSFEKDDSVMEAYNRYKTAVAQGTELNVDLIKFNGYIRYYKRATYGK